MKIRSVLAAAIAVIMLFACVSCGGDKPAETTPAPTTTAAPTPEATTAEEVVTTAEDVTTAEITTAEETTEEEVVPVVVNGYGALEGAERLAYLDVLPALLPDNTPIEEFVRPFCGDDTLDTDGYTVNYLFAGNSGPNTTIVDTAGGAVYGTAFKLPAYGQNLEKRAETTVSFFDIDAVNNVEGARGILFWVDYSHVDPKEDAPLCASVTLNNNSVRANKDDHGSVGYYFKDGAWVETKNVNACRMEVPAGFAGWIYIPATSYVFSTDGKPTAADADGKFQSIEVENMRLYTDGYAYTDNAEKFIIFDEILYVY